jgi:hypothetical protein
MRNLSLSPGRPRLTALLLPLLVVAAFAVAVVGLLMGTPAPSASGPITAFATDSVALLGVALVGTTVDIYSTQTLMGVVENLKRSITNGFAARWYGTVVTSDTELITFDVDEGKRYLAPYVHPDVPAKVRGNKGRRAATFNPAYLKEKEPVKPGAAVKRAAGETFASPMSPQQRIAALVAGIVADQVGRVDRRIEQMAVEAMVTGKIVVVGDGYDTQTVNFGRAATLDIAANTLLSTDQWDDPASNPIRDVRGWNLKMLKESGSVIGDIVLDADSANAFLDHASVQARLDKLNVTVGAMDVQQAQEEGLQLVAVIEGVRYWRYAGFYTNDAGTELELYSGGKVLCVGQVDGVQNFGAIQDHDALVAVPVFTKSYLENDPSVRWILTQSAPLPVPRRINATLVAQVL